MPSAKHRRPKNKCCASKPRCKRCPLRMLADGTLPEGYTVRKRKLVKDKAAKQAAKAEKRKAGSLPTAA